MKLVTTCASCINPGGERKRCNDVRVDHPCRVYNVFTPCGFLPVGRSCRVISRGRTIALTRWLRRMDATHTSLLLLGDFAAPDAISTAGKLRHTYTLTVHRRPRAIDACLRRKWVSAVAAGTLESALTRLSLSKLLAHKIVFMCLMYAFVHLFYCPYCRRFSLFSYNDVTQLQ